MGEETSLNVRGGAEGAGRPEHPEKKSKVLARKDAMTGNRKSSRKNGPEKDYQASITQGGPKAY